MSKTYEEATDELFGEVLKPEELIDRVNAILMDLLELEDEVMALRKVQASPSP